MPIVSEQDVTAAADWQTGRITDGAVAEMRSHIGVRHQLIPWYEGVTPEAIRRFSNGVGDDNPLWWDEAYAATTRWRTMIAPPGFLYCGDTGVRPKELPRKLGVQEHLLGVLGMWGGDRWRMPRALRIGERIRGYGFLEDVVEKQSDGFGGRTILQKERYVYLGDDDETVAELQRTYIRFERVKARQSDRYADYQPHRYSDEELKQLYAHYETERLNRRGGRPLAWDDIILGDPLGLLAKGPYTLTSLVAFYFGIGNSLTRTDRHMHEYLELHPGARVVNEFTNVEDSIGAAHWEEYFWKKSGLPNGYDVGPQRISWMTHLVTDWCGDNGRIVEMDGTIRRPNFFTDLTWISGEVVGKRFVEDEALGLVDCVVKATNQRGEETARLTATVEVPRIA